jgi:hypothetical protein
MGDVGSIELRKFVKEQRGIIVCARYGLKRRGGGPPGLRKAVPAPAA